MTKKRLRKLGLSDKAVQDFIKAGKQAFSARCDCELAVRAVGKDGFTIVIKPIGD